MRDFSLRPMPLYIRIYKTVTPVVSMREHVARCFASRHTCQLQASLAGCKHSSPLRLEQLQCQRKLLLSLHCCFNHYTFVFCSLLRPGWRNQIEPLLPELASLAIKGSTSAYRDTIPQSLFTILFHPVECMFSNVGASIDAKPSSPAHQGAPRGPAPLHKSWTPTRHYSTMKQGPENTGCKTPSF
jgi:hypothetical protein